MVQPISLWASYTSQSSADKGLNLKAPRLREGVQFLGNGSEPSLPAESGSTVCFPPEYSTVPW